MHSFRVVPHRSSAQCRCFYGCSRQVRPSQMAAYYELLSIHVGKAFDQAACRLCMSSAPSLAAGRSARATILMIRTALVMFQKIETAFDPDSREKAMSLVQETWNRITEEKMRALEVHAGIEHAKVISVGDLAQFRASLATLLLRYSDHSLNATISRIYPSLDHIKSFTRAITACTQASGAASLVWGAGLVLLEVRPYPIYNTR